MVKNWMILGDEAFNSKNPPLGILKFDSEEVKDWQSIAWRQLADSVNNNEMVKRMVFSSNRIILRGVFYKKSGVTLEQLDDFSRAIADTCDNIEYGRVDIMYDSCKDNNMLIICFSYYEPDMANSESTEFCYVHGDKVLQIHVDSDSIFS